MWATSDQLRQMVEIFLYVALACLWNFLAGYAGLVSVGQQAYVGLGGYALFALAAKAGVPPLYSLPLIGLGAALLSVPIALLLFRLRGAYFAITSWVVAEVFRLTAILIVPLGGGSGMSLPVTAAKTLGRSPHARFEAIYIASLVLLVLVLALIFLTLRSRLGLALTAIRDNELAARSNGVNVDRTKLIVYVAAAAGTAMIGAVIFLQKLRISPDSGFSVNDWTALVIFMVVIGGIGTFEGPILGTLDLFRAARHAVATRAVLSDDPGRGGDRGDAVRAARAVGGAARPHRPAIPAAEFYCEQARVGALRSGKPRAPSWPGSSRPSTPRRNKAGLGLHGLRGASNQ